MFNRETVRQQYIKNLLFTWHNSHSKLIFVASKSSQYKQGLQEKQARIHGLTQEDHKSKPFFMKKITPIHCLHPIFSFPGIHLVHMQHAITVLFSKMPELKAPQTVPTGQMGKAFILFPERLCAWHAWKKTKPYMTLLNFPPLSLHETELSSRSQRVVKVSTLFVSPGKEGSGHWILVKNLHSGTSPSEHSAELEISPN